MSIRSHATGCTSGSGHGGVHIGFMLVVAFAFAAFPVAGVEGHFGGSGMELPMLCGSVDAVQKCRYRMEVLMRCRRIDRCGSVDIAWK